MEIILDITLWKQTDQDLVMEKEKAEEGQQKLKESHDIAKLGSWELDIESGIFTFTDSFYKIFHTNALEMGGYKMSVIEYASNFVYPDDSSKVAAETQKAIETQDLDFSRYVEHRIIYKGGGIGYMGVWFFVVKDKSGKTIKTYGINQDITGRKMAELELLKAKEKAEENEFFLRESQKAGNIGSYKTDFVAGIWKSSETLDRIFGTDDSYKKDVDGWLSIVHPDDRQMMNDYFLNEVIREQKTFAKEYRIKRINDNETPPAPPRTDWLGTSRAETLRRARYWRAPPIPK
jgi:PAS domain-containing protein